jgi:hypothetical protein
MILLPEVGSYFMSLWLLMRNVFFATDDVGKLIFLFGTQRRRRASPNISLINKYHKTIFLL